MKNHLYLMVILVMAVISTQANAALIKIEGTVRNASVTLAFNDIIPIGAPVSFSFLLDVGDGLPPDVPAFDLISGSLAWENDGAQVVNLFPGPPTDIISEAFDFYRLSFAGAGPAVGRFSLTGGAIDFNFGVNLQTTSMDFFDLLLSDTVTVRIGLTVTDVNGTGTGLPNTFFTSDVRVTEVSDVPLPAAFPMFFVGVLGLMTAIKRRPAPRMR